MRSLATPCCCRRAVELDFHGVGSRATAPPPTCFLLRVVWLSSRWFCAHTPSFWPPSPPACHLSTFEHLRGLLACENRAEFPYWDPIIIPAGVFERMSACPLSILISTGLYRNQSCAEMSA